MRKIELAEPDFPGWKRWRKDCDAGLEVLREAFTAGRPLLFKEKLYGRRSIKRSYFFAKAAPFFGKCAYCEAPVTDFQHPDVEHFRPKAAVTDEEDRPIPWYDDQGQPLVDAAGQPRSHPGYWWLAYDWKNLLPSCGICNQASSHAGPLGKRNRFPVEAHHARSDAELPQEKALLIHPGLEDPGRHLKVRLDGVHCGALEALDKRGGAAIRILGLNARDQLLDSRKTAIREALYLAGQLRTPDPGKSVEEAAELRASVEAILAGTKPYSMAQMAVLEAAGILAALAEIEAENP